MSQAPKPLLQLSGLERRFPAGEEEVRVLKDINLTIHAGEMVAIVGQSGSGKSTLMNILGCLDRPSTGSYKVDGRETRELQGDELATLRREYFGFIFQRYHLLPHLSAEENVEIPAVYAGADKQQRRERARSLLGRLGLDNRTLHRPSQLSGGQQQRVSIARALMNGGDVILADEPTGALDSHSGEEVMNILRELHARGHTVIIVTHDMQVASNAQRIIELHDGEVVADRPNGEQRPDQTTLLDAKPTRRQAMWMAAWGRFGEAFKMAWIAMASHRMRTLLTMLGIIIGITSVVSIVALGQGARQKVINDISSIGTNTIDIVPGNGWGDDRASTIHTLNANDLSILQQQFYIDSATPGVSGSVILRYGNVKASASVSGVGEQYFRVRDIEMADGQAFSNADVRRQAQSVVIDDNTRNKLFKTWENPVGKVIFLGGMPATVVAVAKKKESAFGSNTSLEVYLPYTTAMGRLLGQTYFNSITVRVRDGMPNDLAEASLTKLLTLRHGTKDFFTNSSDSILKTVEKTTATLTLLISAIAVISLVVGGIGVMNIMLVSVTERTHEIGIRMAVGARQNDIMQQFLIEAVLVCLIGGLIGVVLSFGIGAVFSIFVKAMSMQFSIASIVAACVCSTLIGVIFGYLPARNAARLDPIQALARE
ncbi:macrolide ABC transporter ATP-binding protein/permease MacB [Amantichitinum ursilacus]|uniref:Macrolide export ATP-binding/permease protein MacB n=1 Tax=Amantichitinum ursilacus TaxID=857265 RepID=A0A0N0XIA3_9NEIS|nr:macrolide ABC transporter ATP-binding protein/permease MacB [Amantichitinum ursilacus]KPC49940.1 Macrolide export ATP-binding/permease protein MacB [Amantichitinum ursilacus]